jgi:hypothetical protein
MAVHAAARPGIEVLCTWRVGIVWDRGIEFGHVHGADGSERFLM